VAHEINNPLSFVVSNFDTLQKYVGRVAEMVAAYRELNARVREEATASLRDLADKIEALERKTKLDYILGDLSRCLPRRARGSAGWPISSRRCCCFPAPTTRRFSGSMISTPG
jgi:signal transduction histidine kinase